VHAIVIPEKGAAQINEDTVKTSAGAVFNIPICREKSLLNAIDYLKNSGLKIIACTEKSSQNIYDLDFIILI